MSDGWGNPIVGGTTLRIPAIQSTNFVTQVSGWQITAAGNAEFNQVQARGQVFVAGANGSEIAIFLSGGVPLIAFVPQSVVHATIDPSIFSSSDNPGAANELMILTLSSGKESGNDDAAIQLFSESADATFAAQAVIEFGGAIAATITKVNAAFNVPVQPGNGSSPGAKIWSGSGAPTLSGTAGDLFIRTNGGAGSYLYRCTGGTSWTAFA